ncbi:MAG: asparagine synthase (glutamine-hydrolyzing) [Blastocatellia bacterium]
MCGIAGYMDMRDERRINKDVLVRMTDKLIHRGPDSSGYYTDEKVALGFRRLSIIDLETGDQPIFNEDGTVVLICNGEIYNYRELRQAAIERGHSFYTNSDVEVLVHLYEDYGLNFLNMINGQFAFVLYDSKQKRIYLARDHFGINPLYYTVRDGLIIFGSEIKAILEHPRVRAEVDLTGLDQVLSLPGLVSPRTLFKGISSLRSGHYITLSHDDMKDIEYWDLDYPREVDDRQRESESYYVERLKELLIRAVKYRLQADVPVGFYLSGGLDSSLIAAIINAEPSDAYRQAFSIAFTDSRICESKYQRMVASFVGTSHHEIVFDVSDVSTRLSKMIYHSECPVKETYNTCCLALSEAANNHGANVILSGEGADELFAGYVGYKFDRVRQNGNGKYDLSEMLEEQLRESLWGDKDLFYEKNHYAFSEIKTSLYSDKMKEEFNQFNCLNFDLINKERLKGRSVLHKRSYLDFKLRLSDHLICDHGDKMALANSVEARYPFLDQDLVEFAKQIPPDLKLNGFNEKYILKKVAANFIPENVINREKFGFQAPGTPLLLLQRDEWINDLLSYDLIKRQGYFDPDVIEGLKTRYSEKGFRLNLPFEDDLLLIVLTFGIAVELFKLPSLN